MFLQTVRHRKASFSSLNYIRGAGWWIYFSKVSVTAVRMPPAVTPTHIFSFSCVTSQKWQQNIEIRLWHADELVRTLEKSRTTGKTLKRSGEIWVQLCGPHNLIMIRVMFGNDVIGPGIGQSADIIWWNWNCQLLPAPAGPEQPHTSDRRGVCVTQRQNMKYSTLQRDRLVWSCLLNLCF